MSGIRTGSLENYSIRTVQVSLVQYCNIILYIVCITASPSLYVNFPRCRRTIAKSIRVGTYIFRYHNIRKSRRFGFQHVQIKTCVVQKHIRHKANVFYTQILINNYIFIETVFILFSTVSGCTRLIY